MERKFYDIDQNSEEWFKLRIGLATSSNFAVIMANSPNAFGNPAHEYAMRIALESTNQSPLESFSNVWTEHGTEYEPMARERYEQDNFVEVSNGGFYTLDKFGSSPDGLVGTDGLIEIKCPKWNTHFKLLVKGGYNTAYRWQIQGQLLITGRKWCDFVSFCEDFPEAHQLYTHRIEASLTDQGDMIARLTEFNALIERYKSILR